MVFLSFLWLVLPRSPNIQRSPPPVWRIDCGVAPGPPSSWRLPPASGSKPGRKMKQIHGQRLIMVYQLISTYIYMWICEWIYIYICGYYIYILTYMYIYRWTCKVEIQPELSAKSFKYFFGREVASVVKLPWNSPWTPRRSGFSSPHG